MKIAIARLRSRVVYTEPLHHIMDSFYHCLKVFMDLNPQHEYLFYNFSFGGKTKKDPNAIKDADVILIPSENEFHAWVPNYLHPLNLAKSNEQIEALKPYFNGKKVIILSNDRADTPELYRQNTLKGCTPASITCLDEDDFPLGIHTIKYEFIRSKLAELEMLDGQIPKKYDFIYWGTEKRKLPGGAVSGDERHTILKGISKVIPDSFWVGRFANIKRNLGMVPMNTLVPLLAQSRATLCFNWLDSTAITSRYAEAMASGVIPLVWKNYDSTGRLGISEWQRCHSLDEVVSKIQELSQNPKACESIYDGIHYSYMTKIGVMQKETQGHLTYQEAVEYRFMELLTKLLGSN